MMLLRVGFSGLLRVCVVFGAMFAGGWGSPRLAAIDRITLYLAQPGVPFTAW